MDGSFVFVTDALQHSATNALPYVYALQHCHEKSASVFFVAFAFFLCFCFFCLAARLATCSGSILRKRRFRFIVVKGLAACSTAQLNYRYGLK